MRLRKIDMRIAKADLTAVVAVVFQLLTLFVIVINFENSKAEERLRLPKDQLAKPPAIKSERELVLSFGYRRNDSDEVVTTIPEVSYNEQYFDVRQIGPELETERRDFEKIYGDGSIHDVTVVIIADSDVPAGMVQELVRQCKEAGYSRFSLRAKPEEQ